MQYKKAKEIRDNWGDKTCEHPKFEKEYYLGADTGDLICIECGKEFTKNEIEIIENTRKK